MRPRARSRADRSMVEVLSWSRSLLQPALREAVATLPEAMRHIARYHLGWHDEQGRAIPGDSGKALRPALVLLCAEAVGGDAATAVPGAVAVELAHNFSLLHDDVMDRDETRRHRPTAWRVFGSSQAVLAGDALLTLALDVLAEHGRGLRLLTAAVQRLIDGQHSDLAFESRHEIGLGECVRMAQQKTGALLRCSCALGALLGGGSPQQIQQLAGFGETLGLAFQLVDDLLGIWGDPALTGKPVHSDLHSRKKTLPVVAALLSGTEPGRELAELYAGGHDLSRSHLVHAARLVDTSGARRWAQGQINEQLALALRHLRCAATAGQPTAELTALAGFITRRDF